MPNISERTTIAQVGDRARLWLGPPKRGGMHYGEVIGIDNCGHPGVQIRFDEPCHGAETCYATHAEVEVRRKRVVRYTDGTPAREYETHWERIEWRP